MSNKNLLLQFIEPQNLEDKKYFDFLKGTYDSRFYHYGDHFKIHVESKYNFNLRVKNKFLDFLILSFVFIMGFRKKSKQPTIISTAYFNTDSEFREKYHLNVSRPPWAYNNSILNRFDYNLFRETQKIQESFKNENFAYLVSDVFLSRLKEYREKLKKFFIENNVCALFVSNDIGFFEKVAIDIFKELKLPSFAFVHGLQFCLNDIDFRRSDYLVVWGELSKNDFVLNGLEKDKIIVSGHPKYTSISKFKTELRFDLSDILVLTNSLNGIHPSSEYTLTDRSNCIYYLFMIQDVLQSLGVDRVRLRPHPSENQEWYIKNIDTTFYVIDKIGLDESLKKSSLVIGPTSTVFFEALVEGVNYLVFDPENQYGRGLNGYPTPSMYNGNNSKVPVAKNVDQLKEVLVKKKCVNISIIQDVCKPAFSLDLINQIIQTGSVAKIKQD